MKRLALMILLLPASCALDRTVLKCEADSITVWEAGKSDTYFPKESDTPDGYKSKMTLDFNGEEVLMSYFITQRQSAVKKDGAIWQWWFDFFQQTNYYTLDRASGKLDVVVDRKSSPGPERIVQQWQCSRSK